MLAMIIHQNPRWPAMKSSFLPVFLCALPISTLANVSCLQNSTIDTLETLISCLQTYTAPPNYYATPGSCDLESEKYAAAQPSKAELQAWKDSISELMDIDGKEKFCPEDVTSVVGLNNTYVVSLFNDKDGQSFCILSETQTAPNTTSVFARGWGIVVVPANKEGYTRSIHLSVPHPVYDGEELAIQAAALFKRTGGKSLVISGRNRQAYPCSTKCSAAASTIYYKTDPTHDVVRYFVLQNHDV